MLGTEYNVKWHNWNASSKTQNDWNFIFTPNNSVYSTNILNSLKRQRRTFGLKEIKETSTKCNGWALDPDLIKSVLSFFFFEMGKFGYWMLSDLRHYCSFLGIEKIIVLELYFKKCPYLLVIDPELVMAEITSGTTFKLIQLGWIKG